MKYQMSNSILNKDTNMLNNVDELCDQMRQPQGSFFIVDFHSVLMMWYVGYHKGTYVIHSMDINCFNNFNYLQPNNLQRNKSYLTLSM